MTTSLSSPGPKPISVGVEPVPSPTFGAGIWMPRSYFAAQAPLAWSSWILPLASTTSRYMVVLEATYTAPPLASGPVAKLFMKDSSAPAVV